MFLVTGGALDGLPDVEYDSTEILDLMVGRWVASGAKLPETRTGLRAINFNNRVLIFGNENRILLPYFEAKYKYPRPADSYCIWPSIANFKRRLRTEAIILTDVLLIFILDIYYNINVIAGGIWEYDLSYIFDDILEYNPEDDTFTTVGHMLQSRSGHAMSVVPAGDYLQWCQ